jgi:hypothetical protein
MMDRSVARGMAIDWHVVGRIDENDVGLLAGEKSLEARFVQ